MSEKLSPRDYDNDDDLYVYVRENHPELIESASGKFPNYYVSPKDALMKIFDIIPKSTVSPEEYEALAGQLSNYSEKLQITAIRLFKTELERMRLKLELANLQSKLDIIYDDKKGSTSQ